MNKFFVAGRVGLPEGQDTPEVRTSPRRDGEGDVTHCNFTVFSNSRGRTVAFRISAFGQLAESVAPHLKNGKYVMVSGRYGSISTYTSSSGITTTQLNIIADSIELGPDPLPPEVKEMLAKRRAPDVEEDMDAIDHEKEQAEAEYEARVEGHGEGKSKTEDDLPPEVLDPEVPF